MLMLLKLVDGAILEIEADKDYTSGCETCDWGSQYVNEYTIYMETGTLYIEASQEYTYPLSEGYMMGLMLNNVEVIKAMTETAFRLWLEAKFKEDLGFDLDKFKFIRKS